MAVQRSQRPSKSVVSGPSPTIDIGSATTTSRAVNRPVTVEHQRLPDGYFGEAFLVWRCLVCGAVGDLEAFPTVCSDCGVLREEFYYWIED